MSKEPTEVARDLNVQPKGDLPEASTGGAGPTVTTKQEASYRGWLIRYYRQGQWCALLFCPGSAEPMPDPVVATLDEGDNILLQRAQAKIDSEMNADSGPD